MTGVRHPALDRDRSATVSLSRAEAASTYDQIQRRIETAASRLLTDV